MRSELLRTRLAQGDNLDISLYVRQGSPCLSSSWRSISKNSHQVVLHQGQQILCLLIEPGKWKRWNGYLNSSCVSRGPRQCFGQLARKFVQTIIDGQGLLSDRFT